MNHDREKRTGNELVIRGSRELHVFEQEDGQFGVTWSDGQQLTDRDWEKYEPEIVELISLPDAQDADHLPARRSSNGGTGFTMHFSITPDNPEDIEMARLLTANGVQKLGLFEGFQNHGAEEDPQMPAAPQPRGRRPQYDEHEDDLFDEFNNGRYSEDPLAVPEGKRSAVEQGVDRVKRKFIRTTASIAAYAIVGSSIAAGIGTASYRFAQDDMPEGFGEWASALSQTVKTGFINEEGDN